MEDNQKIEVKMKD